MVLKLKAPVTAPDTAVGIYGVARWIGFSTDPLHLICSHGVAAPNAKRRPAPEHDCRLLSE